MSTTHVVYVMVGVTKEVYLQWYCGMFPDSKHVMQIDRKYGLYDIEDYLILNLTYIDGIVGLVVEDFHSQLKLDKEEMQLIESERSRFGAICKGLEAEVYFIKTSY